MTHQAGNTIAQPNASAHVEVIHRGQLSKEQVAAVEKFINQVGGVDNARQALAALLTLEKAA